MVCKLSHAKNEAGLAPLIDIAEALASMEYPGDSRERYALYAEWANDFNAGFEARRAAGRSPEETYLEDIDTFAHKCAAAYGFTNRGYEVAGVICSDAQLEAAMQACAVIFEAYAATDVENGGGARSVCWESLSLAHEWAVQALSETQRAALNKACEKENALGETLACPDTPFYLHAFPDFGRLDVMLPDGFIDQSWAKNLCPSFELPDLADPDAEWPLITLFVDYADVELRGEPDGRRFNLYLGAIQDSADLETDDWNEALVFIEKNRCAAAIKGSA